ncbi:hypothetical protein, partial [Candidatus Albibeggiatoa sp. nov. BB20]|uniref:hypothetical protein n=1 Tax=Candidatus Albibeggiatoa sp. nov. BB20 TaxID=3162723 RepID=UPI003365A283
NSLMTTGLGRPVSRLSAAKPLTHPSLAGGCLVIVVFSFIFLNRPDSILIVFPLLIYATFKAYQTEASHRIKKLIFQYTLGLSPLILWELFSIFYYGYLLPNTAYAKLGAGIPQDELYAQGFYYFLDSIKYDPITLSIILIAIAWSFIQKNKTQILLSIGIILYLFYIARIRGDFMSGRFFSFPFFAALISLSLVSFQESIAFLVIFMASLFFGITSIQVDNNNVLRDSSFHPKVIANTFVRKTGIADERKFYFVKNRALLVDNRQRFKHDIRV